MGDWAKTLGLAYGEFVDNGRGAIVLETLDGNVYPAERVSLALSSWGSGAEGVQKLPRPRVMSADGAWVLSEGDRVVIGFLRGNVKAPVVVGVCRRLRDDDFFARSFTDTAKADPNVLRLRLAPRNSSGAESGGAIEITAGDGTTAAISARVDGGLTVRVGDVVLSVGSGGVSVTAGGSAAPLLSGPALLSALADVLAEVGAGLALVPASSAVTLAAQAEFAAAAAAGTPESSGLFVGSLTAE